MKRTIIIQTHILNILTADELHRFVDNLLRAQSPKADITLMKAKKKKTTLTRKENEGRKESNRANKRNEVFEQVKGGKKK